MEKQDWIDTFNRSKNELRDLVEQFHPSVKAHTSALTKKTYKVTASSAEHSIRQLIRRTRQMEPQNPLTIFDVLAEDPALHNKELTSLLSGAWFGLPESRSVRSLPGFFELCDLCEGVDKEEDTEDLAV
jgi:hypothetical protein